MMTDLLTQVTTFVLNNAIRLAMGCSLVLAFVATILLIVLIRRKPERIVIQLQKNFSGLQTRQDRLELVIKDEIARNRQETTKNAQQARQELGASLKLSSDSLQQRLAENVRVQKDQLDSFSKQLMAMTRLNAAGFFFKTIDGHDPAERRKNGIYAQDHGNATARHAGGQYQKARADAGNRG
jgi:DNA recombination protein RmuC